MSLLVLLALVSMIAPKPQQLNATVEIKTTKGVIVVFVDRLHAPTTADNFLAYVRLGHYNGGRFHRTVTMSNQPDKKVKIEVIQGGVNPSKEKESLPPIPLERTTKTGLSHRDGTVSMARGGADTATSDFFISVGDQPELDFGGKRNPDGQGFAAFGHVEKGMDVVRKIQRSHSRNQNLDPPIEIISMRITKP